MRRISLFLAITLAIGLVGATPEVSLQAKEKVKLSSKRVTVNVGKVKKVSVKNTKKKASWEITKGKKIIKISAKKAKDITITGLKKGKAKIECKVGKKSFVCVVTVKGTLTKEVNVDASQTPAVTESALPEATESASPAATESASPAVTESASPAVTESASPAATESTLPEATSSALPEVTARPTHVPTTDRLMAEPQKVESEITDGSIVFSLDKYYYFYGSDVARIMIESVEFVDSATVPTTEDVLGSFDVSEKQNKSVMAWYKDADEDGYYEMYIGQDGGVIANPNSDYMFCWIAGTAEKTSALDSSKCLLGLENFYTENIESANYMFASFGWYNFKNISLGDYFATPNLKEVLGMFADTGSRSELYLGKSFSVDEVPEETLASMFGGISGRVSKVIVPKNVKDRFDANKSISEYLEVEAIE